MAGRGRGRGAAGQLGPTARDDDGNVLEAASPPKLFPVCCKPMSACTLRAQGGDAHADHPSRCMVAGVSSQEPSFLQDVLLPDRPGDDRRIAELRAHQKKLNDFWRGSVYRLSTGTTAGAMTVDQRTVSVSCSIPLCCLHLKTVCSA